MGVSRSISVSDLALCQKCPALLAYKIFKGAKTAWHVGIKGSGYAYGSLFHKNIAKVFFEGASNPESILYEKIAASLRYSSSLESMISKYILIPLLDSNSEQLMTEQVDAMNRAITVWIRAMSEFFMGIPSLLKNPEKNMHKIFIQPEQKLKAYYNFSNGNTLVVKGCYDALMFNPDKAEARLFEFKGHMKSDITVPLSQSLIYSWLIWKKSGIFPSVEIIYLDEIEKKPDIFEPSFVEKMIKTQLPELFHSAFSVLLSKRVPEILRDKKLCSVCPFKNSCIKDWGGKQ